MSSKEQAENNSSLEIQDKLCVEYAQRKGLRIVGKFGGVFESAKVDGRKEFQRMLNFVRKNKSIAYIVVLNFDRFSRTGPAAAQLSADLRKLGVNLKSISQEIDSSTPSGIMTENMFHIFNQYDNLQRSSRTSTNTREIMLKGYWPYLVPMGYENLKPKHRACDHQYIITQEGSLLKKAFQWKAEGKMSNQEIIEKLSARGLNLTEKNFRWVISNPFYAGYITGKLLNGQLVKGKHQPLVDTKTFLKANNILEKAPTAGIPKKHKQEQLPLKIFVKDVITSCPLTGYIKKNIWYYKGRKKGVAVNINAQSLNSKFEQELKKYEFKKEFKERLRKAINAGLKKRMNDIGDQSISLKKRITELKNQIETLEEKFVLDKISQPLYEKYHQKYQQDIVKLTQELGQGGFDSSNLEKAVNRGLEIAENLSWLWVKGNYDNKQQLQKLIFPSGIMYDKRNDRFRTENINSLFAAIPPLVKVLSENKKGNLKKDCLESSSVPETGIEPAHPCGRQILSLLRLPIPPPGLACPDKFGRAAILRHPV